MTENEALLSALKKVKEQKENFGFMDRFNVDENWEVMKALEEIQQYRAIGTIDEFKALKEKFENAKDDIRKLLSSEYGSSCQFCVHDENEDAMCCNIGGSGSWCCENARWKEH